jgi:hypothetical protein
VLEARGNSVQSCSAVLPGGFQKDLRLADILPHTRAQGAVETFQDFFSNMIFPKILFPFKSKNLVT